MLYTIIFTLFFISPVNEIFEGVIGSNMPLEVCEETAETFALERLPLNVKRAEFGCRPIIPIQYLLKLEPKNELE